MAHFFCPACWTLIRYTDTVCPHCGASIAALSDRPYEDKMLAALRHPVAENRLIAVQVLGQLRSQRALPQLGRIVETETEFYLLAEVLHALVKINTPESWAILRQATHNRSHLVQKLARRLLAEPISQSNGTPDDQ